MYPFRISQIRKKRINDLRNIKFSERITIMRLGTAGNTVGSALYILEQIKQYTVLFECYDYSDWTQWVAVKDV